ncbi:MAG TPA: glycosyltransferase [Vicinamibacteria bacterium]|nr:glycosyltransferase [Vicinamibacteria bacterium]
MSSWVILPTYNEAANVARMVEAPTSLGAGLSVLVVDDDSPDGTGAIAEGLAARSPSVHVIRRRGERGLGTAYLAGFREAIRQSGERLLTMDCDFSHDPAAIPALLAAAESADLVIGSRYVPRRHDPGLAAAPAPDQQGREPQGVRLAELPICFRDREHGRSELGWREAVRGPQNLIRLWREPSG